MDTAGRSPKDEVRIQELRAFLSEADADEVHLVLSSMTGAKTLQQTAERFAVVGTTALILTKLDEASGLGNTLAVLRFEQTAAELLDEWTKRARRHRNGQCPTVGPADPRHGTGDDELRLPAMIDQANELRELVRHAAAPRPPCAQRPAVIVVAGGKGGVGTTTLAVELALAMSRRDRRTLLVDAARGGDAAITCGIEPRHSLGRRVGRPVHAAGSHPAGTGKPDDRSRRVGSGRRERLHRRPRWSGCLTNGRRWGIDRRGAGRCRQ